MSEPMIPSSFSIFFVNNDRSGTLHIDRSLLSNNLSLGFETDPGIFAPAGEIEYIDSVIEQRPADARQTAVLILKTYRNRPASLSSGRRDGLFFDYKITTIQSTSTAYCK
jgi:hypothetical protein